MDVIGSGAGRMVRILVAVIVLGGILLTAVNGFVFGMFGSFTSTSNFGAPRGSADLVFGRSVFTNDLSANGYATGIAPDATQVLTSVTTTSQGGVPQSLTNSSQGAPSSGGGLIEFSSQIGIQARAPQRTASQVVALAYSVGGYVAYQSTYESSAYVVIRVPASEYQSTLSQIEAMGTVVSLISNSNDVRVQYTDLNATLASLRTEQGALLKLLNQSTSITSTLAIESQLQGVDQQINDITSQILQTRTLIQYSTVDVTISQPSQEAPLTLQLSATPKNGTAPLSVTFNAVVKGGSQPYVVNYNFGDGYAVQGQIVIHTFYQSGTYRVTVTATDQNGTVAQGSAVIVVGAVEGESGLSAFIGTISGLFFSVVEGIAEVAVVVLPIAAVGAVVLLPFRKKAKAQSPSQSAKA